MHLGNEAVTTGCVAFTFGITGTGLTLAWLAAARTGIDRNRATAAVALGALVFAAQMLNVPILPFSSAHLVGGVLLAWLLGPGLGAWTMAIVLALQAFLLGDGGTLALGANILNMALVPAALVALARRYAGRTPAGVTLTIASFASIILAAALIVGEVAFLRPAGFGAFAWQILWIHVLIAVGEAAITLALVAAMTGIQRPTAPRLAVACVIAAMLFLVTPFSSGLPDGYEASAQRSGLNALLAE